MQQDNVFVEKNEIDLFKIFKTFKLHIKAVVLIMVISIVLGYAYTVAETKKYESTATMAVLYAGSENETNSGKYNFSYNVAETFVLFISERVVLDKVASKTGCDVETLKHNLTVKNSNLIIRVSYVDTNPQKARSILNEIINTAVRVANTKNIHGESEYNILANSLKVFSSASKANRISNSKKAILLALLIGILLSFIYLIICQAFDKHYRDVESIEEDLDLPVFATVPYYTFEERKHSR